MKKINDREFSAISALPAAKRYQHFVAHVADWGEVWSLKNSDGWVVASDTDGKESIPIWPNPRYAEACAIGPWAGTVPEAIPLGRWMAAWLPGIVRDGRVVAVFPLPTAAGITVTSERLASDLQTALDEIE